MLSLWMATVFLGAVLAYDCNSGLPYDGSRIPDCTGFIDLDGLPYYHEHSSNCSRFWQCAPDARACLFECAPCCRDGPESGNCNGQCLGEQGYQWALTFDEKFHRPPYGPTCVWPVDYTGNCSNIPKPCDCHPWQTCVNDECSPQCVEDSHCPDGYHCDDFGWCIEDSGCTDDNQCHGFDAACNIPAHDNCFYCDGTKNCTEGCSTNDNCPGSHPICGHGGSEHLCGCNANEDCKTGEICDTGDLDGDGDNKECIPDGCYQLDDNCPGHDAICNIPAHDNCFYCDDMTCRPGCIENSNCPEFFPICGYGGHDHLCGCNVDTDCPTGYICECDDDGVCGCVEDLGCNNNNELCPGFNVTCNIPRHDNCFWCNGEDCVIGCGGLDNNGNCPDKYPICGGGGGEHRCGCDTDADCANTINPICDATNHECTAMPGRVLVNSIKIYTANCTGCSAADEGVIVNLLGEENMENTDGVPCQTNKLDHAGSNDFGPGSAEFNGRRNGQEDQAEKNMMGDCYKGPLNSQLNGGGISWEGEGTWAPQLTAGVCVDWSSKVAFAWSCDLSGSGSEWNLVNCRKVNSATCP